MIYLMMIKERMYRAEFPNKKVVFLHLTPEGLCSVSSLNSFSSCPTTAAGVSSPSSSSPPSSSSSSSTQCSSSSSLLVYWKDIKKHMVRKPPDHPRASMKLDLKSTEKEVKPKPIIFDILGMISKDEIFELSEKNGDKEKIDIENEKGKDKEEKEKDRILSKALLHNVSNIDALESLRKFITLLLKGKSYQAARRSLDEILFPSSSDSKKEKDGERERERGKRIRNSSSSISTSASNPSSKKDKKKEQANEYDELDPQWSGARLQREREIARERSQKLEKERQKGIVGVDKMSGFSSRGGNDDGNGGSSNTLNGVHNKIDVNIKEKDSNNKDNRNRQLRLHHQKEIEEKARQVVLKDVIIKEHYKTMVLSGLISEDDFWASRQKNIQDAKAQLRKSIAFSSSILKDIEEKIEEIGNMADSGRNSQNVGAESLSIDLREGDQNQLDPPKPIAVALEKRHIEYIFNLYPKVKELYIREVLSNQMSEAKFWSDFARSLRVHRGGHERPKDRYYDRGKVERLGHDSTSVDTRKVESSINLMDTFSETRYREGVDNYDYRTHDHQEKAANLGNKYNRHGALLITSNHVPTVEEQTDMPDLYEAPNKSKFTSSLNLKGGREYYMRHQTDVHQNDNDNEEDDKHAIISSSSSFLRKHSNRENNTTSNNHLASNEYDSEERENAPVVGKSSSSNDSNLDLINSNGTTNKKRTRLQAELEPQTHSFLNHSFLLAKEKVFVKYQRLELRSILDKIQKYSIQYNQNDDLKKIDSLPESYRQYILREHISGTTELLRHFFTFYIKVKQYKESRMEKKRKQYQEKLDYLKEKLLKKQEELERRMKQVWQEYDSKETSHIGLLCRNLLQSLQQQIILALRDCDEL